ncbi:hypothetical protein GOP47_0000285, partial [Adiantum capillus-veneris]
MTEKKRYILAQEPFPLDYNQPWQGTKRDKSKISNNDQVEVEDAVSLGSRKAESFPFDQGGHWTSSRESESFPFDP